MIDLSNMGKAAKQAASAMAARSTEEKNRVLKILAELLQSEQTAILEANRLDLDDAKGSGMSPVWLDRLSLEGRIEGMVRDVQAIIALPDPIGEVFHEQIMPNGLRVNKQRTPIGVLGVIYEARPNVTIDVSALTIKTGNCAILRGGKEAMRTNRALASLVVRALEAGGLPATAIQFIDDPDRELVMHLLRMHQYVDMIIPRGGNSLHQFCRENSTIPVITGGIGICHLYVDEDVDLAAILPVIDNAKTQRPTVCNALDTLLVHTAVADKIFPLLIKQLGDKGVIFCVDADTLPRFKKHISKDDGGVRVAQPQDWDTEWLGLTLGVKVVQSMDDAIQHIHAHSTGHSDGILTRNTLHAERFVREVDSAAVYVNASTRFTDGSQLGLGGEVAISTQKLHARGPMGASELTTYKWVIWGKNHVRQ